jgi:valyl-tRNA synthetase
MDGSIPWYHAAISGFVLDPDRKKMSKSKGNVTVPTEPLDEYGPDAVRYWAASSRLGVDTAVDPNVYREGKRLVTKLLNAARLILGYEGEAGPPTHDLDRDLIGKLKQLIVETTGYWEDWNHAAALEAVEAWFWSDFTDNYLELSKTRAYAGDASAIGTLRTGLEVLLRLFAPFLPFVTEELWHSLDPAADSIHIAPWPTADELGDAEYVGHLQVATEVLTHIRKAKSEAKVSIKFPVTRVEVRGSKRQLTELLEPVIEDVRATGNVETIELVPTESDQELAVDVELADAAG